MIFIVAIITAFFWHLHLEKMWLSSIGSTSVLLLLIATGAGHPPSYYEGFYSDLVKITALAFVISVCIGIVFQSVRSKKTGEDPPLTTEQELIVEALSEADLEVIDTALLSNVDEQWRKVARVVGTTILEFKGKFHGVPGVFFAQRILRLTNEGRLESQGNLKKMRYSEIRLPQK